MKRGLDIAISSVLFGLDAIGNLFRGILGYGPRFRGVVLYYHRVTQNDLSSFERQMSLLKKWTSPIGADFQFSARSGSRFSVVTFDDAFSDTIRRVVPIMKAHNIPFTVFVPTGFVGKAQGWINGPDRDKEEVISGEDLRKISDEPLVTIGSHCVTHKRLSELDDRSAEEEIGRSKSDIEALIGKPSGLIAFPHGDFLPCHLEMARRCGYTRAFSIRPEVIDPSNRQFLVGRVNVEPLESNLEFTLKITGSYRWKPAVSKLKKSIKSLFISRNSEP